MLALRTSCGKHVEVLVVSEVVISEANRRKHAVWVRAGRGVVGRWVIKKAESQVGVGVRDFVIVSWDMIWEEGFDIFGGAQSGN